MADFNALETLINAYIKKNGVQAITGNILNGVLRGMVSALGKGYTIVGVATPSTDPGTLTGPCAYYASTYGTYTNFGNIVVNDGEIAMLIYDEQTWHKEKMWRLDAEASIDANVGTPSVETSFEDEMLTFRFHNIKGEQGDAAGFGTVTASVDSNIGTPGVSVQTSGPDTAKNMTFQFTNLKGETGVTSVVCTVDNTIGTPSCAVSLVGQELHLDFSGLKGNKGDTGVSADYPITIYNGLDSTATDQALSAYQGKVLNDEISQLEAEVDELDLKVDDQGDSLEMVPVLVKTQVNPNYSAYYYSGSLSNRQGPSTTNKYALIPTIGCTAVIILNKVGQNHYRIFGTDGNEITNGGNAYFQNSSTGAFTLPTGTAWFQFNYTIASQSDESAILVQVVRIGSESKAIKDQKENDSGIHIVNQIKFSELTRFKDGYQLLAGTQQIGETLSNVPTSASSNCRNVRIPVSGCYKAVFDSYSSSSGYGHLVVDENDKVLNVVTKTFDTDNPITIWIPNGAAYLVYSYYLASSLQPLNVSLYKLNTETFETEISIETVGIDTTFKRETLMKGFGLWKMGGFKPTIGTNVSSITPYDSLESKYNCLIPLDGIKSFRGFFGGSSYGYGSAILDANGDIVRTLVYTSGAYQDITVLDGEATLLYSFFYYSDNRDMMTLYSDGKLNERVTLLESKIDELGGGESTIVTGLCPKLYKGKTSQNGATINDSYNVTTETLFGDFWLKLADGFKVLEGSLFDRDGNIVSYQSIHPDVYHSGMRAARDFFSTGNTVPQYGYRLVICKTDGTELIDGETIITDFVSMTDAGLHRWIPDDLPNYDVALRRIDYIQHLRWIPLVKVPDGYGENVANDYFCLPGRIQIGVPYSDVAETRKYVPNNVSIRTFMTAVKNKRSLLYTEELQNNVSKYGFSYVGGNRRSYYGEVCSGFTAWVMCSDTLYLSSTYAGNGVPGLSSVQNPSAQNVRPLDLMWSSGHITIISDIYKDEFGKVVYVVVAEMSTPYPYRTLYTAEQFEARLAAVEGSVHRWNGWDDITEPEGFPEYSQYKLGALPYNYPVNEDIMTFAGDYAAFADGDKIVLNCKRANTWTSVQLYKGDTLVQTIDISGMSPDGIYSDGEDWVAVDLSSYNLTYGKYKARMTDGTHYTDYTYFDVVSVTFSATKSGSNLVVSFGANGGTPVSIEQCQTSGFALKYHPVTSSEVSAGTVTLTDWEYHSYYPKLYILVKGDYGTVCKRLDIPQS